jgi:hypothetical protein
VHILRPPVGIDLYSKGTLREASFPTWFPGIERNSMSRIVSRKFFAAEAASMSMMFKKQLAMPVSSYRVESRPAGNTMMT